MGAIVRGEDEKRGWRCRCEQRGDESTGTVVVDPSSSDSETTTYA